MKVTYLTTSLLLLTLSVSLCSSAHADVAKGKELYNGIGACGSCHGPDGKGDGAAAAALTPKPRSFESGEYKYDTDKDGKSGTEADLMNIIANGATPYGGSMFMTGRPDLSEADRRSIAQYVLSLKK